MKKTLLTMILSVCLGCMGLVSVGVYAQASVDMLVDTIMDRLHERTQNLSSAEKVSTFRGIAMALQEHTDAHPAVFLLQQELRSSIEEILYPPTPVFVQQGIPGVAMDRVRGKRLERNNLLRQEQGLDLYAMSDQLERTAQEWAEILQARNAHIKDYSRPAGGTHRRYSPEEGYYNSSVITQWFQERGIAQPTTENVGYGAYRCREENCTGAMEQAISKTYDFFVSEKSWGGPHYKSMISPRYTHIGVGIAVDRESNKYRLVVHYGLE